MNSQKYLILKRIYCRVHHLTQGFPFLLPAAEVEALNYDLLKIAEREEELNLLGYIKVSYDKLVNPL